MKMSEVSVEDITKGLGDTAFGLVVDGGIIRDRKRLEEIVKRLTCHDELVEALELAMVGINDNIEYEHNGDPWTEDRRAMGEMELDDMNNDGRIDLIRKVLAKAKG